MEDQNLYDKLRELQAEGNHKINILQESVDITLQMAYYRMATNIKKDLDSKRDYLLEINKLYDPEIETSDKKKLLCTIASIEKPEYFRALEQFKTLAPQELKDWTTLAIQESKMLLESSLLETKLLYISTGLGGKGSALRFFLVIIGKDNKSFTESQIELLEKELEFQFNQNSGEIEEIKFDHQYAQVLCLLPLETNIGDIVKKIIKECNTYGNFIEENFLLTNVKKLELDEIAEFFAKDKSKNEPKIDKQDTSLNEGGE